MPSNKKQFPRWLQQILHLVTRALVTPRFLKRVTTRLIVGADGANFHPHVLDSLLGRGSAECLDLFHLCFQIVEDISKHI